MTEIKARIHGDALERVSLFFDATLTETLTEVLQNARRSGATGVDIRIGDDGSLTITDDGCGIADPATLLAFGESGWADAVRDGEQAAGMGVYALARWRPEIASRTGDGRPGWSVSLDEDHFRGARAATLVPDDTAPRPCGTRVKLRRPRRKSNRARTGSHWEDWLLGADAPTVTWREIYHSLVADACRYYPLPIRIDGVEFERREYLEECCHIQEWEGLRIGIRNLGYFAELGAGEINFHGRTINRAGLPSEMSIDGRRWTAAVDVVGTSTIELTLPGRSNLVEGDQADRMRETVGRTIFRAMAAASPPAAVSWKARRRAAALGVELPEPEPRLQGWRPEYADVDRSDTGKEMTADETVLVMPREVGTAAGQTLWHAVRKTALGARLAAPNADLEGYGWYDRLARVTAFRIEGTSGGEEFRQNDPETRERPAGRPERLEVVIETTGPNGDETLRTPAEIALWRNEDDVSWIGDAEVLVRAETEASASEIADLLKAAYFSPSEDRDCDSYETQQERFEEEALRMAHGLIDTRAAVLERMARRIAEQHVAYEVGNGQSVTMTVSRDGDGKLDVAVEAR